MKIRLKTLITSTLAAWLPILNGCSTAHPADGTETVMVTYHVQSGKKAEFQALLGRAWTIYQDEHLVLAQPHVIVQDAEDGGRPRFVEIFTWKKAPDKPSPGVKAI